MFFMNRYLTCVFYGLPVNNPVHTALLEDHDILSECTCLVSKHVFHLRKREGGGGKDYYMYMLSLVHNMMLGQCYAVAGIGFKTIPT